MDKPVDNFVGNAVDMVRSPRAWACPCEPVVTVGNPRDAVGAASVSRETGR